MPKIFQFSSKCLNFAKSGRTEFDTNVAFSQNGKADKREVLTYLDPKHPYRAQEEASRLLQVADRDDDGFIDLGPILQNFFAITDGT